MKKGAGFKPFSGHRLVTVNISAAVVGAAPLEKTYLSSQGMRVLNGRRKTRVAAVMCKVVTSHCTHGRSSCVTLWY